MHVSACLSLKICCSWLTPALDLLWLVLLRPTVNISLLRKQPILSHDKADGIPSRTMSLHPQLIFRFLLIPQKSHMFLAQRIAHFAPLGVFVPGMSPPSESAVGAAKLKNYPGQPCTRHHKIGTNYIKLPKERWTQTIRPLFFRDRFSNARLCSMFFRIPKTVGQLERPGRRHRRQLGLSSRRELGGGGGRGRRIRLFRRGGGRDGGQGGGEGGPAVPHPPVTRARARRRRRRCGRRKRKGRPRTESKARRRQGGYPWQEGLSARGK